MLKIWQKASILIFLFFPLFVFAETFFVDPKYDFQNREKIFASLQKTSSKAYFFVETEWFINLNRAEREEVLKNLEKLSEEFDQKIYPTLTSLFGTEWNPGIDKDPKIFVLFHRMKEGVAGYFNSGNEYPKIQNPKSNEKEIIFLNTDNLNSPLIKSYLAHEFLHLITFNQKERLKNVEEDLWLNELRSEIVPTILGYDDEYQGSNLQQRVKQFLSSPSDSLTEWAGLQRDYAIVNLFGQYLIDHYGTSLLIKSLKSEKIGIESINQALKELGYQKDFSQIFTEWLITLYLGDCSYGKYYCYKNENLKNLKIVPSLIFLPSTQITEMNLTYSIKDWTPNFYRIFGGEGIFELIFNGQDSANFKIVLILCKNNEKCEIKFLPLDSFQDGKIYFENLTKDHTLVIIPLAQTKISGFTSNEPFYDFSIKVSLKSKEQQKREEELIQQLLSQIEELKKQIAFYQQKINEIMGKREEISCKKLERNLYFGLTNDPDVRCLQQFLKSQGPEIYPEGLVTGNFFHLTKQAVIRFQEKYKEEILKPLGLEKGTGFVGPSTRSKINQLLGF